MQPFTARRGSCTKSGRTFSHTYGASHRFTSLLFFQGYIQICRNESVGNVLLVSPDLPVCFLSTLNGRLSKALLCRVHLILNSWCLHVKVVLKPLHREQPHLFLPGPTWCWDCLSGQRLLLNSNSCRMEMVLASVLTAATTLYSGIQLHCDEDPLGDLSDLLCYLVNMFCVLLWCRPRFLLLNFLWPSLSEACYSRLDVKL